MTRTSFTPALLALALTGFGGFLPAAAGDRDIAEIQLRANGATQRIEVDMNALAPGETRQLIADSGLPAVVSRSEEGLRVEIAGEVRDIQLPPLEMHATGDEVGGRKVIITREHVDSTEGEDGKAERREIRIVHRGDAGDAIEAGEIDSLVAEAMAEADAGELEGDQVRVIRRVELERQD